MTEPILEAQNISKKYCRKLKRSMYYGCIDIIKDVFNANTNSNVLRKDEFWSVDELSFKMYPGECLGIIGPNGAGKSTLLKMLNGIIKPDKGEIKYQGIMGALIEVGAGFHPVLTGRENIFINGSILGLSKAEIREKYDEIVEFSELGEFLDTPVKNYSSGMRVKLGFSIASHVNPDILLIDEVLAVGDMAFQTKCRRKISELIQEGTSVIFISHNMNQISNLCTRAILVNKGKVEYSGDTLEAVDRYKKMMVNKTSNTVTSRGQEIVTKCQMLDKDNNEISEINTGDFVKFKVFTNKEITEETFIFISLKNSEGVTFTVIRSPSYSKSKCKDECVFEVTIPKINVLPGLYFCDIGLCLRLDAFSPDHKIENAISFLVKGGEKYSGFVYIDHSWEIYENK